ncbi:MAG: protein kinase [Deltaproteobacteria bacterium]|nr:protein kinase [Deltaproteobacteria bacterium]
MSDHGVKRKVADNPPSRTSFDVPSVIIRKKSGDIHPERLIPEETRPLPEDYAAAPAEVGEEDEPSLIAAGQRLGSYRINEKIGAGGMGCVYAATHLTLGRRVAIKVLRARYVFNDGALRRFFAEARVASQISHPNIVAITDFIEGQGGPASYVMEYLEGQTLYACLRRRKELPLDFLVEIAEQMARGLEALHDAGVVHRDVKPTNIFLVGDDERVTVKLLDFGLVKEGVRQKARAGSLTETCEQSILGTPAYMPPEQMGNAREVDQRADLYAYGTVLYEMLCGYFPFKGNDDKELLKKRLTQPPEPMTREGGIPQELEEVVLRCLAAKPEERPQSISEVLSVLALVRETHLTPTLGGSRLRRLWLLLGLLGAVSLGGLGTWLTRSPNPKPAASEQRPAEVAIAKLQSWKRDVTRRRRDRQDWEKAKVATDLFHLDTLRTGKRSRATITFMGAGKLKVSPHSEVLIEVPRRDPTTHELAQVVRLREGKLALNVTKKSTLFLIDKQGRVLRLKSEGSASLRFKARKDGKTEVAVIAGSAMVHAGDNSREIREGQVMEANGTELSKAEALPPFPKLLLPGIDQRLRGNELTFSWQSVGPQYRYHFQLGSNIGFDSVLLDRGVQQPSVVVENFPPGSYAWRVRTLDTKEHEGEFGFARRFQIVAQEAIGVDGELLAPRDRARITLGTKPRHIVFRWKTKAKQVLFVLSRQQDLEANRVLTRRTRGRERLSISSRRLRPGTYYWGLFSRKGKKLRPLQESGRRLTLGLREAPRIKVKVGGWN